MLIAFILKLRNQSFSDLEKYEEYSANKIFKGRKWHSFPSMLLGVCCGKGVEDGPS